MLPRRLVPVVGLLWLGAGCREGGLEQAQSASPTAAAPARISTSPAASPAPSVTPPPAEPLQSAVYDMPVPTPSPRPAPAPEPPREESHGVSRRDLISHCLVLTASVDPSISFGNGRARLEVHARNACAFPILGAETAFRIESLPLNGGAALAHESGSFQTGIEPNGSASTLIEVDCPAWRQCRYAANAVGGAD